MHSLVQPDAWVALKLPSGNLRVLQVTPNTTISLGKYGSFPSNLVIHRPYHLTYELVDRQAPETFNRLRIVPAHELYSDILSSSDSADLSNPSAAPADAAANANNDADNNDDAADADDEYALVDPESGAVVAKAGRAGLAADIASADTTALAAAAAADPDPATQALTLAEIEELKRDGTDAGKALIAKLILSHSAIDQKTQYSLAKYKLLKTRKYIRRFSILPLDLPMLDHWLLEEKDPGKILDMREEMVALLGCWGNVHFAAAAPKANRASQSEPAPTLGDDGASEGDAVPGVDAESEAAQAGRWLVVDDTGGLLVAALAERMGVLYPPNNPSNPTVSEAPKPKRECATEPAPAREAPSQPQDQQAQATVPTEDAEGPVATKRQPAKDRDSRNRWDDMHVPFARTNTLTLVHANSQPNISYLRYFDFDIANPLQPSSHPLASHLMTLSWLQMLEPSLDSTYASAPPSATPDELRSWKANRRGTYHRKRRRWARIRHIVDDTRRGEFSGLVVASTMDPISILRHAVPLLAGGAPVAIYSQSVEPLTALADCYSIARRAAWVSSPPEEAAGRSPEDLENWAGTDDFPLNPSLLLGAAVQTSRIRRWQVLPGRTHPLMTSRGGPEGYVFTAWRVKPAEGKVEARGKQRTRKRKAEGEAQ